MNDKMLLDRLRRIEQSYGNWNTNLLQQVNSLHRLSVQCVHFKFKYAERVIDLSVTHNQCCLTCIVKMFWWYIALMKDHSDMCRVVEQGFVVLGLWIFKHCIKRGLAHVPIFHHISLESSSLLCAVLTWKSRKTCLYCNFFSRPCFRIAVLFS